MAATPKTPSQLAELRAFAANLSTVPYDQLLSTAASAGWQTFIQEIGSVGQADGTVLVTFQVFVGKDDKFEPFDQLSVKVSPGPGPVSAVARRIAYDSLVPLFFNRYPQASAPVQQTVEAPPNGADIVLPADDADDGGEYVPDVTAQGPTVVERLEPDGVPIFVDLYALGAPYSTADVIGKVLDEVDDFLQRAQSVETINAMGVKNPMMLKFVKDLGEPKDVAELKALIDRRRNEVAPPVLSNARRRSAAPAVN